MRCLTTYDAGLQYDQEKTAQNMLFRAVFRFMLNFFHRLPSAGRSV
ncbi:hypothetical protein HMPREF0645_2326 [Hallella bergensis DSM 17361]|uniref:Uncharacterized protein n=1 Tax=Hallella bergensis DSM 17361 TaxID=585502 RepID=D1PZE1_9BACT|nr:hypothetical protein HMPREF0645_2326 [Hallella bergensis DSM 17361]